MREDRWMETLRMVLIIAVIVAVALAVVYGDDIIAWISKTMFADTHSQLRELLR